MKDKNELRTSVMLNEEQMDAILSIRQRDEYRRCSISAILRMLLVAGLKAFEEGKVA